MPQGRHTNVITSCTQSKRLTAPDALHGGNLDREAPVEERCLDWCARLQAASEPTVAARDLYKGDHWQVSLEIAASAPQGHSCRLWVASAGHGLIDVDCPVHSYAATFRTDQEDSVVRSSTEARAWWTGLTVDAQARSAEPSSLEALVAEDPAAGLIVVASPSYINALEVDLSAAIRLMSDASRAIIVSAGKPRKASPLSPQWLSFDARIRTIVGGGMQGLNARVARFLCQSAGSWPLTVEAAQACLDEACHSIERFRYPSRDGQSDAALTEFIEEELRTDSRVTKTGLLRKLRSMGLACEQKRFGALFNQVKHQSHGQAEI